MGTLRQRVTLAVLAYTTVVTLVVAAHGYMVNERAERLVWESLLESELTNFVRRRTNDPNYRWRDTESLHLYGSRFDSPIPVEFEGLPVGIHDEVASHGRQYIALVTDLDHETAVLALDISDLERHERISALYMAAWMAPVLIALAIIAYIGAGRLVEPLTSMARTISSWSPSRVGQRLDIGENLPSEASVIAQALNGYGERLDEFLERERAFINMASHELRTPIAVISGAIDVALDMNVDPKVNSQLEHARRTTRDMNCLVSLLLALAKDPSKLREADESVDLEAVLRLVTHDHEHLAKVKNLSLSLDIRDAPVIDAPLQIVRAAVGNLVRNAIASSDGGSIVVKAGRPGWVTVSDPGHGMTEREMSLIYTRLARSGHIGEATAGIGIELIARLCGHLGWRLTFESEPGRGTLASIWFTNPEHDETEA